MKIKNINQVNEKGRIYSKKRSLVIAIASGAEGHARKGKRGKAAIVATGNVISQRNEKENEMTGFRQKLALRQKKIQSIVCVGLDPIMEKCPDIIRKSYASDWRRCARWMMEIVDSTVGNTLHFKPQCAHYEAIEDGRKALQAIIDHIHNKYPEVPVFLDCKRGDIDRTQQRYRIAHLEMDGVDGMNFNPYMGWDCMEQLVSKINPGAAIVGLCYTSNPSAREVQDVLLADGRCYWEFIADRILDWSKRFGIVENAGLVMAAAYEPVKGSGYIFSKHLSLGRVIVGSQLWYLVPGIGTQQGFIKQTITAGYSGPGSMSINNSSAIIFASSDSDFAEASADVARKMKSDIIQGFIEAGLTIT